MCYFKRLYTVGICEDLCTTNAHKKRKNNENEQRKVYVNGFVCGIKYVLSESVLNGAYSFVHLKCPAVFRCHVLMCMRQHSVVGQFPFPTVRLQSYPFLNCPTTKYDSPTSEKRANERDKKIKWLDYSMRPKS